MALPEGLALAMDKQRKQDASQDSQQSLPTPPGSDADSPPPANDAQLPDVRLVTELPQDTGVDPSLLSAPGHANEEFMNLSRAPSRRPTPLAAPTPTFKSLSSRSPSESPPMFNAEIPGTPDIHDIINSFSAEAGQNVERQMEPLTSRNPSLDSEISTGSGYRVEQELTQLEEEDEDDDDTHRPMQLSDLIVSEKLSEPGVTEDDTMPGIIQAPTPEEERQVIIKMPDPHFSSQEGLNMYEGEIFQARAQGFDGLPSTSAPSISEGEPTFSNSQIMQSTPNGSSQLSAESTAGSSSSSNLSAPAPAQPLRIPSHTPSPMCDQSHSQEDSSVPSSSQQQHQHQQHQESSFSKSFFPNSHSSSAPRPFYGQAPLGPATTTTTPTTAAPWTSSGSGRGIPDDSPPKNPAPAPRRRSSKGKGKAPRTSMHMSGTMNFISPAKDRYRHGMGVVPFTSSSPTKKRSGSFSYSLSSAAAAAAAAMQIGLGDDGSAPKRRGPSPAPRNVGVGVPGGDDDDDDDELQLQYPNEGETVESGGSYQVQSQGSQSGSQGSGSGHGCHRDSEQMQVDEDMMSLPPLLTQAPYQSQQGSF